jgi:lysosomal Pro-X carboxypeptidase
VAPVANYTWETHAFEVPLSHFDPYEARTISMRVLVNREHWGGAGSPVLFYAGNEGAIEGFARATGAMWDMAPQLGALLVFAEHRFYGASQPQQPPPPPAYRHLSSEQTIADFASLLGAMRAAAAGTGLGGLGVGNESAVVAVGGSYGGMLAAWLRAQHPGAVDGALAASAPVRSFPGQSAARGFYDVVSADFNGAGCGAGLRRSFGAVWAARAQSDDRARLASAFALCPGAGGSPALQTAADVELLVGYLQQQLVVLAQLDYPCASHFIGTDLPASPVNVSCALYSSGAEGDGDAVLWEALRRAVSVGHNSSSGGQCLDLHAASNGGELQSMLPGLMPGAWSYQRCVDIVIPNTVGEGGDASGQVPSPSAAAAAAAALEHLADPDAECVFLPCAEYEANCWRAERFSGYCNRTFGPFPQSASAPQPLALAMGVRGAAFYGGWRGVRDATNIFWSNGVLDPWSSGGVIAVRSMPPTQQGLLMPGAAHHLDLRASNAACDPPAVVSARAEELRAIRSWVQQRRERLPR